MFIFTLLSNGSFLFLGIVVQSGNAQDVDDVCTQAISKLSSSCAVSTIDELASMEMYEIDECCQFADDIRQFDCFDPCNDADDSSSIATPYSVWRPLCNHPTPKCGTQEDEQISKSSSEYGDAFMLGEVNNQYDVSSQNGDTNVVSGNQTVLVEDQLQRVVQEMNKTIQESYINYYYAPLERSPVPSSPVVSQNIEVLQKMFDDPELSTSAELFSQNPTFLTYLNSGSSLTLLAPTNSAWLVFAIKIGLSLPQDLQNFKYIQQVLLNHMVWGKHQLSQIQQQDIFQLLTLKQDLILRVYWNQGGQLLVEGCCEDGNQVVVKRTDAFQDAQVQVHVTDDVLLPPSAFDDYDDFFKRGIKEQAPVPAAVSLQTTSYQDNEATTLNLEHYLTQKSAAVYGPNDQGVSNLYNNYIQLQEPKNQVVSTQEDQQLTTNISVQTNDNQTNDIIQQNQEDSTVGAVCQPVGELLESEVSLGSLYTILKHAQLIDIFDEIPKRYGGEYSLLVPTNEAFGSFLETHPHEEQLLDQQNVELILSYLIISTKIQNTIQNLSSGKTVNFDTILKQDNQYLQLKFRKYSDFTVVTGNSGSAIVTGETRSACNATVYFIDSVVLPFERKPLY